MTNFNPNSPGIVGLEWPATRRRWAPLARNLGLGAKFGVNAAVAVAADAVWAFLRFDKGPTNSQVIEGDIFDGNAPIGNPPLMSFTANLTGPAGTSKWVRLVFPGGTNFMPGGFRYLVVLRLGAAKGYGASWATLDCTTTVGHTADTLPIWTALEVPLDPTSHRPTNAFREPQLDTGARAICIEAPGGTTIQPDSQPYSDVLQRSVGGSLPVVTQTFQVPATDTFDSIWVPVLNNFAEHAGPLVATVLDGSGAILGQAQVGTIGPTLPQPPDQRWYLLGATFDPDLSLAAGVTYTVRYSSVAATSVPWVIASLLTHSASGGIPAMDAATWGGTVTAAGGGTGEDTPITAQVALDPITGLHADAVLIDVSRGLTNCVLPALAVTRIGWDPHDLGFGVAAYEIERNDDGTWWPVASITREEPNFVTRPPGGATAWFDFEALRNAPVQYRVRVRADTGAVSAWSVSDPITLPSAEPDVILATNWRPPDFVTPLIWAGHDEPGYSWHVVDADKLALRMLQGQNRQVGFREAEFRGDTFDRSLIVAFADPNMPRTPTSPAPVEGYAAPGRVVFDGLLDVAHHRDVPYVVFLDARARRWYTAPAVKDLHEDEPQQQYRADATFTEVSDRPIPVTLPYLSVAPVVGVGWDYQDWDDDTSLWEAQP